MRRITKIRRITARIIALSIILSVCAATAGAAVSFAASDVPKSADYYDAVERVTSLGLMDNIGNNAFKPDEATTREQFAKLIIIAASLGEIADTMKGSTVFSDVPADGEYNGYINACLKYGYMAGLADGRFHPEEPVTFAQAATAMVRALGYTDDDVSGTWPKNYIEKARALGLTEGLTLGSSSSVPRWTMARMLDALLDTKVKTAGAQDTAKTLAEASGLTADAIYSVYSKPEVYYKSALAGAKIGDIDLGGNVTIVRNSVDNSTSPATVTNGEIISAGEIKDFSVVYQVSDKTGKNRYILVIDNKVTGTITGILPDKFAPRQVEVDGVSYNLDSSFNIKKLAGSGSFGLNDEVTLLLGRDGKVVDILEALYSDNSSFAFVMNYTSITSNDSSGYGMKRHTVKLLMPNGSVNTFDSKTDPSPFKGKLVIYKKEPDGSVALTGLDYSTPGEVTIDKVNRKILSNYNNYSSDIAGNVKIFNFISNEDEVDAQAQLLGWNDLPSGVLQSGKVLFMNKTGDFEDVNLILLNNVTAKNYKLGIVKTYKNLSTPDKQSYSFTIAIDGKDYTYTSTSNDYGLGVGSVVKVSLQGNAINNILEIKYPDTQASMIQAVDGGRIRVNSRTYTFTDDKIIYLLDSAGSVKEIDVSLLRTDTLYSQVAIYTDIDFVSGGKAEMVVVKSY